MIKSIISRKLRWGILMCVIHWCDGINPPRNSSVTQDVIAKSYLTNEEVNIKKACDECKNLVVDLRNVSVSAFRTNASTHYTSPRDAIIRFCRMHLQPVEDYHLDVCSHLANHFTPPTRYQAPSTHLHQLCEISGVCDREVIGKDTTTLEAAVDNPTGIQLLSSKTMDPQPLMMSGLSHRAITSDDIGLSSNLTAFGWGGRVASSPTDSAAPITFVQISDIHLDLHYERGSPSQCRDKICCRLKTKGSGSAGQFGDYRCDSVKETVDALMASIAQINPKPDFFIYVGDSPPHSNGRDETLAGKLSDNKAINDMLREALREIAPIYPTVGNHDMFPENVYYSRGKHTQAILKELAVEWAGLFPLSDNQQENVQTHGFYTTLIKEGLRILSINSLYAYRLNPVALLSVFDPLTRHQHRFIRNTLDDARSNSEKVIVMSHMKPSHVNTYPAYTLAMERLVKEYQDLIVLMLYGHEHTDTFVVSTDPLSSRATGAFLAAPSITPYIYYKLGTNPSYRVFSLDENSLKPLDYVQYYVDLKQANENSVIEVKKHYRFTEEYNLPDLTPQSFKTLADRISNTWEYYEKFERNKDVLVKRRRQCQKWNRLCRRALTCETTSPTKLRYRACLLSPF